jgi:hypothetical protein
MSLRIKPDVKEKIAELARQDRRTVSAYIEMVLEDHLGSEKRSKKNDAPLLIFILASLSAVSRRYHLICCAHL